MKYTVLSLFPALFEAFFRLSIPAKAVERGLIQYQCINIRDCAEDKHRTCDDAPYGGGAGMLMKTGPLGRALDSVGTKDKRVLYFSPAGRVLNQKMAEEFSREPELLLICGHYEGIDQRIIDLFVDDEVSVGDYVLSSGESAALVFIDATFRLVADVINPDSLKEESFRNGLLEYPQYTRPEVYQGIPVPEVLMSGHHEKIRQWRIRKQIEKTVGVRPDLIESGEFEPEISALIQEYRCERDKGNRKEPDKKGTGSV